MRCDFGRIFRYYEQLHKKLNLDYKATEIGLWAYSRAPFVFYFFRKLSLNTRKLFLDAGSGNGLVVAIASLFSTAVGIERNLDLCQIAKKAISDLQLKRCSIICADYHDQKIWQANVIYLYPDKPFDKLVFLLRRFNWKGELWVYGHHIPPKETIEVQRLTKGKDSLTVYKIVG